MCIPACTIQLAEAMSRRRLLRSLGLAACATAAVPALASAAEPVPPQISNLKSQISFQRVVDLTHTLSAKFPTPMPNGFAMEQVSQLGKDQYNAFRWRLHEHVGTHLDAPLHFSDLDSGDQIPPDQLIGPLAIVDIRERAASDPDTTLSLADLRAWESKHGRLPEGAVVAMNSGWDVKAGDAKTFFGIDEKGGFHVPGFQLDAVQFLFDNRNIRGIASDTLSLDAGQAAGFPVHHYWLGRRKWGLENVANLGQLPPVGATIIVGSPKIAGCTGGPSRVLALV